MKNIVTFARALADETRWRIIRLVTSEAMCVCELADILGMPQSSVSSHVQIIRKAGLLESEKIGKWAYFRLTPEAGKLLAELGAAIPETSGGPYAADAKKAKSRLRERAGSCCPGPVKLVSKSL